ncbi:hypothetical protein BC828DRAFT_401730 [Blastocladiella britannica]|nr:hypothetical protein BC828DRAFT_401730 [Blastocladiella britannica]
MLNTKFKGSKVPIAALDTGVIQSDAVTLNVSAAQQFVLEHRRAVIDSEVAAGDPPVLIISDASYVAGTIAKRLGVPAIVSTNFTWDAIYWPLVDHANVPDWLTVITADYTLFDHWFLQVGAVPSPHRAFDHISLTQIPVFGHVPTAPVSALELHHRYGIPPVHKLALLAF